MSAMTLERVREHATAYYGAMMARVHCGLPYDNHRRWRLCEAEEAAEERLLSAVRRLPRGVDVYDVYAACTVRGYCTVPSVTIGVWMADDAAAAHAEGRAPRGTWVL